MAHIIQLGFGLIMHSVSLEDCTKSWEAHEYDQKFGQNESLYIWKSLRLRNEGNATINQVSAINPGIPKIIEKVHMLRNFESPQTDLHIAENACYIDYADTDL